MDEASDVATQRRVASEQLMERLSSSDDPVLAYKATLLRDGSTETGEARALRARIPGSPTARALLRIFDQEHDGTLLMPGWGGRPDRIHYPIQFYDVLFALQVMAELGRLGDPRCGDALALLESKRLPDGGFPLEQPNASTADSVASRHSYANWGPSGLRQSNPLVSLAALSVLRGCPPSRR